MQNKGNMSARVSIALISKSEVDEAWRDAAHLVRLSQKRVESYTGMADIYEQLLVGGMDMWTISVEDKLKAAAITATVKHPRKRVLKVVHIGGFDMGLWIDEFIAALREVAHQLECSAIHADCRSGWAKVLPQRGFKEVTRVYGLEI
jgi:hypothetical protein